MKEYRTLLLLVVAGIIFISGGILNKTFDYEHYGTVSDWIMILVTIVTAYYLYETLQSQKNVQRDQEKINKLQTIEIRKKFKPQLLIEQLIRISNNYSFILKICDNPVHNLRIDSKNYFTIDNYDVPRKEDDSFKYIIPRIVNNQVPIKFTEMSFILNEQTGIDNIINEFSLSFEDEFGFKYSKTILLEYNTQTFRLTHRTSNDDFHLAN